MTDPHEWEKVDIDAGPAGDGEFWQCKKCYCAGGPTTSWAFHKQDDGTKIAEESPREPVPFLAGAGLRLSEDCSEAAAQMRKWPGMALPLLCELQRLTGANPEELIGHITHLKNRAGDEAQRWLDTRKLVKELDEWLNFSLQRPGMYGPTPLAFDVHFDNVLKFRGMLTKDVDIRKEEVNLCKDMFKQSPGAGGVYDVMIRLFGEESFWREHPKNADYIGFYYELARRIREKQDT
jgi:hypothetical protein